MSAPESPAPAGEPPQSSQNIAASIAEVGLPEGVGGARDLHDDHLHQVGVVAVAVDDEGGDRAELLAHGDRLGVDLANQLEHHVPALEEERVEDLVLGGEVVVDEPVRHAGLVGDVRHAAGVEPLAREHAHGRFEDQAALVGRDLLLAGWQLRPARGRARGAHARTSSPQR